MEHQRHNMEQGIGNTTWEEKSRTSAAADARPYRVSSATRYTLHATRSAGFSIVETIVAIAILSLAVVAPMTLAERGLSSSVYARDQVTAFYLAQEAVEFIRNVRDSNNLAGQPWLAGLSGGPCFSSANGCGVDSNAPGGLSNQIIDCNTQSCLLTFNPSIGVYGERRARNGRLLNGWQDSIFSRFVTITFKGVSSPNDNNEADIAATVSWQSGAVARSISVSEKIFNWFPPPAQ